jgi:cysteine-rich repeat protein
VNWVSFWDATRFANWLHNGQPTGAQDNTTTEDGAYTLTPTGITNNTVTRNAGAVVFVPSEDEWYKAAYYAGSGTYYDYPAGSNTQTTCALPGETANTANCDYVVYDVTPAGSYAASPSPHGTFDQGGNVWEWSEAIVGGLSRGRRGGGLGSYPHHLAALSGYGSGPANHYSFVGFRVASIPEPTCGDGAIQGFEQCDDDGTTPGDGCDATCQVESGWTCVGEPSVCSEDCGDGILTPSEECDDGNTDAGDCCSPTCQYEPAGTLCRASAGDCDISETCSGSDDSCPADAYEPATTECRAVAGVCDVADYCDGASAACTADVKSTSECRASTGACDVAEVCDGVADNCPADAFEPNGSPCEDGDVCTEGDACNSGICSGSPVPDPDEDGVCGGADNCPVIYNPLQENSDELSAGDACQCGDLDGDGVVDADDVTIARQHLVGAAIGVSYYLTRCNVTGPSDGGVSDCDVADIYVLERVVEGESVAVENTCQSYTGP